MQQNIMQQTKTKCNTSMFILHTIQYDALHNNTLQYDTIQSMHGDITQFSILCSFIKHIAIHHKTGQIYTGFCSVLHLVAAEETVLVTLQRVTLTLRSVVLAIQLPSSKQQTTRLPTLERGQCRLERGFRSRISVLTKIPRTRTATMEDS